MPSVTVLDPASAIGDATVVIGAYAQPGGAQLAPGAEHLDGAIGKQLAAAYRRIGGSGSPDEVVKIATLGLADYPLLAVTGLGARPSPGATGATGAAVNLESQQALRRAIGAAARALGTHPKLRICIADPALNSAELAGAAAFGAVLGGYRFGRYKGTPSAAQTKAIGICVDAPSRATAQSLRRALALAQAVALARDLVNMPPNDLYPESFATQLRALAGSAGVDIEVLAEKDLARQGFSGLLTVGRGSVRGPRLVRLHYRPSRPRASVALVGEGTTFNSGGLHLKTAHMSWSKADMAGAAAAAAVVLAAARLKLPIAVSATLPLAENLPSASSYRPSDIVAVHGGRTVEVTDTEASGRLIVAEAIVRAVSDRPDYLIEASTLTAAQRVALGPNLIAVMGEPTFRDQVVAAGTALGEGSWAMPLPAGLRAGLDSSAADLSTVGPDRWGAMLVGGLFLADFVPASLPWAHLDIAGPAWNTSAAHGYTPKGGTGAGVVTMFAAIEALAAGVTAR